VVKKEDRGKYECIATSVSGKQFKHHVEVTVEYGPIITVPDPVIIQALHFEVDLQCDVQAYPKASVQWLKDGVQLSHDIVHRYNNFEILDSNTF